jgi:hypothetical protein
MCPKAPVIHGLIKLHKQSRPLCPIVNWRESPGYKIGKHINSLLKRSLTLPYSFNVQNSHNLAQSLSNIEIDQNIKLFSFDIENMFTNTPTSKLVNIIENIMSHDHSINKEEKNELIRLVNIILEQNYFNFNSQFFKQNEVLQWELLLLQY